MPYNPSVGPVLVAAARPCAHDRANRFIFSWWPPAGRHPEITVDSNKMTVNIDQTHYIDKLLERFHVTDCNPGSTPMIQRLSAEHGGVQP